MTSGESTWWQVTPQPCRSRPIAGLKFVAHGMVVAPGLSLRLHGTPARPTSRRPPHRDAELGSPPTDVVGQVQLGTAVISA